MSRDLNDTAGFERQLQALLEESVRGVGGHARSRLNQARQAAIAEAARRSRWPLPLRALEWARPRRWMPATGVLAAAALVAFVLWPHAPQGYPAVEVNHTTVDDLDLLADRDGMDLMQGGDGQFYEWAMAQAAQGGTPAAPGGSVEGKGQSAAADSKQNSG